MRMYEIVLSTKDRVAIDEIDYEKFKAKSGEGNFIALKQAVINPSFVVAIIPKSKDEGEDIEGYVDEERGVFVATRIEKRESPLTNKFPESKALADKFKISQD